MSFRQAEGQGHSKHSEREPQPLIEDGAIDLPSRPGENRPIHAEAIQGADDRKRVDDVHGNPFRWICQTLGYSRNGPAGQVVCGSAFVVDARHVITAAHTLFYKNGVQVQDVMVYVGLNGDRYHPPFGIFNASQFKIHPDYRYSTSVNQIDRNDIAILRLNSQINIGSLTNHGFPYGILSTQDVTSTIVGSTCAVSGYPQKFPKNDQAVPPGNPPLGIQQYQYYCSSQYQLRNGLLEYLLDTDEGQSGAPIIAAEQINNQTAIAVAIGIHTAGKKNDRNYGVPFTQETLTFIHQYIGSGPLV